MSPPADAFCRIIFRDMMAFPVQAAARRGRERRVQARFSRRETHLLVLFAVVLQQACCNGKGFRTELAVPCYAFTMQESSKMIKRRTRKRTSGFPLFIGAMPCGDMVCGGVSGTARTVGPFCGRENGIRSLCFGKRRARDAGDLGGTAGRRRIFCVRPSLKTLRKPFGPKALRTLKGYIMAVSRRSRHLCARHKTNQEVFPCVN